MTAPFNVFFVTALTSELFPDGSNGTTLKQLNKSLAALQKKQATQSEDIEKLINRAISMATKSTEDKPVHNVAAHAIAAAFAEFSNWMYDGATALNIAETTIYDTPRGDTVAIQQAGAILATIKATEIARAGDDAGAVAWASYLFSPPQFKANKFDE